MASIVVGDRTRTLATRCLSSCLPTLAHSRHSDSAKKTTSPNMLLSLGKPSPGAAAAATLLLGETEGEEVVASGAVVAVADTRDDALVELVVPLPGEWSTVTVKLAGCVDDAETLGRVQVVVGEVVQSAVAWATSSGLGLVSCAWARVVAPRAARTWEGRIG